MCLSLREFPGLVTHGPLLHHHLEHKGRLQVQGVPFLVNHRLRSLWLLCFQSPSFNFAYAYQGCFRVQSIQHVYVTWGLYTCSKSMPPDDSDANNFRHRRLVLRAVCSCLPAFSFYKKQAGQTANSLSHHCLGFMHWPCESRAGVEVWALLIKWMTWGCQCSSHQTFMLFYERVDRFRAECQISSARCSSPARVLQDPHLL